MADPASPKASRIALRVWIMAAVLAMPTGSLIATGPAAAQSGDASIVVDGLLDGVDRVALEGSDYEIGADLGLQRGGNLFFSFERFGLETGESATFSGPASVSNILSRVTGSERSMIDGVLRSTISGASLYLVNPNGIVMGENASLDMSGAFHASTADVLEFADGGEFHATTPALDTPLSMASISAFGFLSANPAAIEIDGSRLNPGRIATVLGTGIVNGQPISLTGGDITIRGPGNASADPAYLYTGGERFDLVSLDSSGRVRITNRDPAEPGSVDDLIVEAIAGESLRFGDVRIEDSAAIISGGPPPETSTVFVEGSGDVRIRARDLRLSDAEIRTITTSRDPGGDVDVDLTGDFIADGQRLNTTTGIIAGSGLVIDFGEQTTSTPDRISVTLRGTTIESLLENTQVIRVSHIADGDGGTIDVDARNVEILGGAKLSSSGVFGGDGGQIRVNAEDTVRLAGTRQDGEVGGLFSNALEGGDSGQIDVVARRLEIEDQAGIFGEVRGGDGAGGLIDIDVDQLLITNSGRIDTTSRNKGRGGLIEIDAEEWVRLDGRSDDFRFSSITTFSFDEDGSTPNVGRAGTIRITTPELSLSGGAEISTAATGLDANGGIDLGAGVGDGGLIDIRADVIELDGAAIRSSAGQGTAGDIYLNAGPIDPVTLELDKPAEITPGKRLVLRRSEISTNANDGAGPGGDIAIDPEFVILSQSAITATAEAGRGGNIVIVADEIIRDAESPIDASSRLGVDGNVAIRSSGQELRDEVVSLPSTIPSVVELLRERCAARRTGSAAASFVVRGRDGVPTTPDDYLPARHRIGAIQSEAIAIYAEPESDGPAQLILGCRVAAG